MEFIDTDIRQRRDKSKREKKNTRQLLISRELCNDPTV